ncbi:MAG: DUF6883 domain-containing protein [Phycisphaeraceae bacterium]
MKLPNGDRAIIEDDKLLRYALNPEHPRGRHHAHLFERLLGIDRHSAPRLKAALQQAARDQPATLRESTPHGEIFEVRLVMESDRGRYNVVSAWIIRTGESVPRLVTAYVK